MTLQVSDKISEDDANNFIYLFTENIPNYYPYSTDLTAKSIINSHNLGRDPYGYFSKTKKIWKAISKEGLTIGFTVVTEKRGGSIKFGPTLIQESYRNQGVGSNLRLQLEAVYAALGYRKAYSTTNAKNIAAIFYLLKIGYTIEACLKRHYTNNTDELILGKFISDAQRSLHESYLSTVVVDVSNSLDENNSESEKVLLRKMQPFYSEIDKSFIRGIRDCLTDKVLKDEQFYVEKKKVMFKSDDEQSIAITVPKRGGCVKASPIIFSSQEEVNRFLLLEVINFYRQKTENHKIYTLCPLAQADNVLLLKSLNFVVEGVIREPYKQGVDFLVLSYYLN